MRGRQGEKEKQTGKQTDEQKEAGRSAAQCHLCSRLLSDGTESFQLFLF